jgi:hypothetical protein
MGDLFCKQRQLFSQPQIFTLRPEASDNPSLGELTRLTKDARAVHGLFDTRFLWRGQMRPGNFFSLNLRAADAPRPLNPLVRHADETAVFPLDPSR